MEAYRLEFKVRDYECDLEGIVNNAVYMNYLEHTRHEYFLSIGMDFAALAKSGINLIVVRAEMDYKFPLRSGDRFYVTVTPVRESRIRLAFMQNIFRLPDEKPIMTAKITGTAMNEKGRPCMPAELNEIFGI